MLEAVFFIMEEKKRNAIIGSIAIVLLIIFTITIFIVGSNDSGSGNNNENITQTNKQNNNQEKTLEDIIKELDLKAEINRVDDNREYANAITVYLNSKSYSSAEDTKFMTDNDMAKVYYSIYSDNNFNDIEEVTIASFLEVTDQYGNEEEKIFYQTKLDKETAEKINWDQDEDSLIFTFIPKNWTVEKDRMDSINW